MTNLPWSEKLNMFQVHPDAATCDDVARMAEECQQFKTAIKSILSASETMSSIEFYRWIDENRKRLNAVCGGEYA